MSIIEVTSREFRQNQKSLFEKADKGERIIIKRGTKQSYVLVPITSVDLIFSQQQGNQFISSDAEIKK